MTWREDVQKVRMWSESGHVLFSSLPSATFVSSSFATDYDFRPSNRLQTIADFEDRFDGAKSSTLIAAATTSPDRGQQDKEDFIRMLHTYSHAGVLYAYHRSSCFHTGHFVAYHSRRLFRLLRTAEEQRSPLINFAWPIFIAGLCSWPDLERMDVVRKLCRRRSEENRFACYESISAFHQALWDSEHRDWIRLAKDWREQGQQITAI
ncbi:hypothetical protein BDZ85DRAFT_81389 [Elsinoe ampelina]|uniref:Fungal-specific transcription factor domain-containing protein n=1 Tax=Elsinoe ampelina TaxID=302913 RepID=A0A6A6FYH0_9PEZI|nr:hypothetical protein BDZ85DRAFT_81389 [Elsinoe ampelina]